METLSEENKKQFRYAGFWLRFLAYLIDSFILNTVGFLLALPFIGTLVLSAVRLSDASANDALNILGITGILGSVLLIILIKFVGGWLYYAIMQSSKTQATLGKMAIGAIVTDLEGNRLTFGRATARYFSKMITDMTSLIGYILAGITEKKQALHDMIAGTLVILK
jgi:uncharacterized RDD family membrane protein YckC